MKIKAEKWIINDEVSYKLLEVHKCCDKIIDSKNIKLNSELDEDEYFDESGNYSVKIVRIEEYHDFKNEYYETIEYCPFCGKPIEIEIVREVDKTEEYNNLNKERNVFWKKCCNTDSKKEEELSMAQVRKFDIKLNKMLESDDFKRYNKEEF